MMKNDQTSQANKLVNNALLLGVVSRIDEYPGKDPAFHTVIACDDNAILVGCCEFIIEQNVPDSVK